MGHDSWNLVPEVNVDNYSGIILSPINAAPNLVIEKLTGVSNRANLDVVLDPQFYIPNSVKGELSAWPHFDPACETTDLSDATWWKARCGELASVASEAGANSICSPAILPRIYDNTYYDATVSCAEDLVELASLLGLETLLSVVVSFRELAIPGAADRIASIVTRSSTRRVYLIFYDDLTAREQWTDVDALVGSMNLIGALEASGSRVLVGYCGLDAVLWKYCGASSVASGKFLNLRRFGPERWQDIEVKGRVVEYWTEPSLLTWLREDDVLQLLRRMPSLVTGGPNPFSGEILTAISANPRAAWRALSWRQYLWWFGDIEAKLSADKGMAIDLLGQADGNWSAIEKAKILLFDRTNDGSWIRPWLNAIHSL